MSTRWSVRELLTIINPNEGGPTFLDGGIPSRAHNIIINAVEREGGQEVCPSFHEFVKSTPTAFERGEHVETHHHQSRSGGLVVFGMDGHAVAVAYLLREDDTTDIVICNAGHGCEHSQPTPHRAWKEGEPPRKVLACVPLLSHGGRDDVNTHVRFLCDARVEPQLAYKAWGDVAKATPLYTECLQDDWRWALPQTSGNCYVRNLMLGIKAVWMHAVGEEQQYRDYENVVRVCAVMVLAKVIRHSRVLHQNPSFPTTARFMWHATEVIHLRAKHFAMVSGPGVNDFIMRGIESARSLLTALLAPPRLPPYTRVPPQARGLIATATFFDARLRKLITGLNERGTSSSVKTSLPECVTDPPLGWSEVMRAAFVNSNYALCVVDVTPPKEEVDRYGVSFGEATLTFDGSMINLTQHIHGEDTSDMLVEVVQRMMPRHSSRSIESILTPYSMMLHLRGVFFSQPDAVDHSSTHTSKTRMASILKERETNTTATLLFSDKLNEFDEWMLSTAEQHIRSTECWTKTSSRMEHPRWLTMPNHSSHAHKPLPSRHTPTRGDGLVFDDPKHNMSLANNIAAVMRHDRIPSIKTMEHYLFSPAQHCQFPECHYGLLSMFESLVHTFMLGGSDTNALLGAGLVHLILRARLLIITQSTAHTLRTRRESITGLECLYTTLRDFVIQKFPEEMANTPSRFHRDEFLAPELLAWPWGMRDEENPPSSDTGDIFALMLASMPKFAPHPRLGVMLVEILHGGLGDNFMRGVENRLRALYGIEDGVAMQWCLDVQDDGMVVDLHCLFPRELHVNVPLVHVNNRFDGARKCASVTCIHRRGFGGVPGMESTIAVDSTNMQMKQLLTLPGVGDASSHDTRTFTCTINPPKGVESLTGLPPRSCPPSAEASMDCSLLNGVVPHVPESMRCEGGTRFSIHTSWDGAHTTSTSFLVDGTTKAMIGARVHHLPQVTYSKTSRTITCVDDAEMLRLFGMCPDFFSVKEVTVPLRVHARLLTKAVLPTGVDLDMPMVHAGLRGNILDDGDGWLLLPTCTYDTRISNTLSGVHLIPHAYTLACLLGRPDSLLVWWHHVTRTTEVIISPDGHIRLISRDAEMVLVVGEERMRVLPSPPEALHPSLRMPYARHPGLWVEGERGEVVFVCSASDITCMRHDATPSSQHMLQVGFTFAKPTHSIIVAHLSPEGGFIPLPNEHATKLCRLFAASAQPECAFEVMVGSAVTSPSPLLDASFPSSAHSTMACIRQVWAHQSFVQTIGIPPPSFIQGTSFARSLLPCPAAMRCKIQPNGHGASASAAMRGLRGHMDPGCTNRNVSRGVMSVFLCAYYMDAPHEARVGYVCTHELTDDMMCSVDLLVGAAASKEEVEVEVEVRCGVMLEGDGGTSPQAIREATFRQLMDEEASDGEPAWKRLLEMVRGFEVRDEQVRMVNKLVGRFGARRPYIEQLLMGWGKSSVLMPALTCKVLAQERKKCVVVVPSHLHASTSLLTGALVCRWMGVWPSTSFASHLQSRLTIVRDVDVKQAWVDAAMDGEMFTLKDGGNVVTLVDEHDMMINPLTSEMNVTTKSTQVPGVDVRLKFIRGVLSWVMRPEKSSSRTPEQVRRAVMEAVRRKVIVVHPHPYFANPREASRAIQHAILSHTPPERHPLITNKILPLLSLRMGVNYGWGDDERMVVVPYKAKGVPDKDSRFEDFDVKGVVSLIPLIVEGLGRTHVHALLTSMSILQNTQRVRRILERMGVRGEVNSSSEFQSLPATRQDEVVSMAMTHLGDNVRAPYFIDLYVECVLSKRLGEVPTSKAVANGVLFGLSRPFHHLIGFTGTPSSFMLYRGVDPSFGYACTGVNVDMEAVEAIRHNLTTREVCRVTQMSLPSSSAGIMRKVVARCSSHGRPVRALLDVSATIVGMSPEDVAREIAGCGANGATHVGFIDSSFQRWSIHVATMTRVPGIDGHDDLFMYFDQASLTGVDVKLHPTCVGVLLVNTHAVLRDVAQAAYRLRGLREDGQTMEVWLPSAISNFHDMLVHNEEKRHKRQHAMYVRQFFELCAVAKVGVVTRPELTSKPSTERDRARRLREHVAPTLVEELLSHMPAMSTARSALLGTSIQHEMQQETQHEQQLEEQMAQMLAMMNGGVHARGGVDAPVHEGHVVRTSPDRVVRGSSKSWGYCIGVVGDHVTALNSRWGVPMTWTASDMPPLSQHAWFDSETMTPVHVGGGWSVHDAFHHMLSLNPDLVLEARRRTRSALVSRSIKYVGEAVHRGELRRRLMHLPSMPKEARIREAMRLLACNRAELVRMNMESVHHSAALMTNTGEMDLVGLVTLIHTRRINQRIAEEYARLLGVYRRLKTYIDGISDGGREEEVSDPVLEVTPSAEIWKHTEEVTEDEWVQWMLDLHI